MNFKKNISVYNSLFSEALKITWHHKKLWLLGILASILASGGIIETVLRGWQNALRDRQLFEQAVNGTIPGYQWLTTYSRYLALMKPEQQYLLATIILLLIVFLIVASVFSQSAILSSALEKPPATITNLLIHGRKFFWPIFSLDILAKLAVFLLFLIAIVPTVFLNPLPYSWHKFLPLLSFIIFIPGAIFITTFQMIALAAIVRKHLNTRHALIEAWHIFRLHIAVSLETSVILCLLSLLISLAVLAGLLILSLPIALIFIGVSLLSSPTLYTTVLVLSVCLIIAIIFLAGGFITVFQYTTWSLFFEEASRFGIIPLIKKIVRR